MSSHAQWADNARIDDIARQRKLHHAAIRLYFSPVNPAYGSLFLGKTPAELDAGLESAMAELDAAYSLLLMTVIEALFKIDFTKRCQRRSKDSLSRRFRELHKVHKSRIKFGEDILEAWKTNVAGASRPVSDIRSALKYRDWLAHGRYWVPKLGRRYDFPTIYDLASVITTDFDFKT